MPEGRTIDSRVARRGIVLTIVWLVAAFIGIMIAGPHSLWWFGGICMGWLGAVIAVAVINAGATR